MEKTWGRCGSNITEWQSKAGYLNTYYTKSRELVSCVKKNLVTPKRAITKIEGHKVYFSGETEPSEFDAIVWCTGYKAKTNFTIDSCETKLRFEHIFVPDEPNIAFVGTIRPYVTSIIMLVEMQSRLVAKIFASKFKLPAKNKMEILIRKHKQEHKERFPHVHDRLPFLEDPYDYCYRLAKLMKQKPNYFFIFLKNPKLWFRLTFNSWTHYQYRLKDPSPHKSKLATKQINKLNNHNSCVYLRKMVFDFKCLKNLCRYFREKNLLKSGAK